MIYVLLLFKCIIHLIHDNLDSLFQMSYLLIAFNFLFI